MFTQPFVIFNKSGLVARGRDINLLLELTINALPPCQFFSEYPTLGNGLREHTIL